MRALLEKYIYQSDFLRLAESVALIAAIQKKESGNDGRAKFSAEWKFALRNRIIII